MHATCGGSREQALTKGTGRVAAGLPSLGLGIGPGPCPGVPNSLVPFHGAHVSDGTIGG